MEREGENDVADWEELRAELTRRGIDGSEAVLPGDDGVPDEGALHIRPAEDGWALSTVDYGIERVLRRARSEDDIAEALIAYIDRPVPELQTLDPRERERLLSDAAPHLLDLANRAGNGLLIDVPPSLILNRIGALDGIHLYPAETSFEARSLPPTALSSSVHEFVTAAPLRMTVVVTPPWFGHPGGGLRLTVEEPATGLRDLVVSGSLMPIHPATA